VFRGSVQADNEKTLDFFRDGKLLMPCLYGVNEGTLQLCIPDGDEPPKFTAGKGSGQRITMFKRG